MEIKWLKWTVLVFRDTKQRAVKLLPRLIQADAASGISGFYSSFHFIKCDTSSSSNLIDSCMYNFTDRRWKSGTTNCICR